MNISERKSKTTKKLILAATLALASCCSAQTEQELPNAPSSSKSVAHATMRSDTESLASLLNLTKETAKKERVFDKVFVSSALTDVAFMGTDLLLSVKRISRSHNNCIYEINPLFGSAKPTALRYSLIMPPITIGANLLSAVLKKHHSAVWALPQAIDGISHFVGVISNSSSKENWSCSK